MSEIRVQCIESVLVHFAIIDILFLPYMSVISMPYSQLFVFLWFIYKGPNSFRAKDYKLFLIFSFLAIISTVISFFTMSSYGSDVIAENIKRLFQFTMGISYYFLFVYYFQRYKFNVIIYLEIFIIYVFLWALIFYTDFDLFLSLKVFFNAKDSFLDMVGDDYLFRFNFIWSDPNNVGYALVGVLVYLLINSKLSTLRSILFVGFSLFTLITIMSTGSWLALLICSPFALYSFAIYSMPRSLISRSLLVLIVIPLIFYMLHSVFEVVLNSDVAEASFDRTSANSGDSRVLIWIKALETHNLFYYVLFGTGYMFYINQEFFSVHSGHLLLIYSFGFVAYICYMRLFFFKNYKSTLLNYVFLIPFFLCFTLNIGIGEQKYACLFYLLCASYSVKNLRYK